MSESLKEMSNEELWRLFPIILKPYNVNYPYWYEEEKDEIVNGFGPDMIKRISHIGSTSVEGLEAKPTIDILLEVPADVDFDKIKQIAERLGYICQFQIDHYNLKSLMCMKGYTEKGFLDKVFHLHIRRHNDHAELYFRDILKESKHIQGLYVDLKRKLAIEYKNNRDLYTDKKTDFIKHYTEMAREKYPNRYQPK